MSYYIGWVFKDILEIGNVVVNFFNVMIKGIKVRFNFY